MSSSKFSKENITKMSDELLRAVIRERTHHTIEQVVYKALEGEIEIPESFGKHVRTLLAEWKRRNLSTEKEDLKWAKNLLKIGESLLEESPPEVELEQLSPLAESEKQTVKDAIRDRRSIRSWKEKEVPESLIKKIIKAGLWAPHSCNLQTIRVITMKGSQASKMFKGGEINDVQVMLVVCQDQRPYEFYSHQVPSQNRFFDCGAAIQNMLLMAHTLGLASVWLTYGEKKKEKIRKIYKLPDYIKISSFVALGFAERKPLPPGRMGADEATIDRSTFSR